MSGSKKKLSLAAWIFIALVLGCILGGILIAVPGGAAFIARYIKPIGTIFINLLKFIVVPIVLFSMVCGMISMKDIKKVGSIGWKTMVYYIGTTIVALVIGLVMLIKRTKIGMAMRAVSRDFETSQLMGIKINSVISMTFIIGSALAAVGSMLYFTNYSTVTPTVGAMPGLKAFVAAVFGGIGSIPGAVIGAFIIGICENLIKGAGYTAFSDAFTFALLIAILLFKPNGLFGEKLSEKV